MSFNLTIHVFIKEGDEERDFHVSDDIYGDELLERLASEHPEAEIMVEDRNTHEPLTDRKPLNEFLAG